MRLSLSRIALVLVIMIVIPATALAQVTSWTQTTALYKVVLSAGPVEAMLTPNQAKGATAGEVMVPMSGMSMPSMSMTDQGHPVNHHLEVHVYNRTTGQVLTNLTPTISITNSSGATRQLSSVGAMYGVTAGQSDYHYGNNVYLANGTYIVTVQIGDNKATFSNVVVQGPTMPANPTPAMPGMSSSSGSGSSSSAAMGSSSAMSSGTSGSTAAMPGAMPSSGGFPLLPILAVGATAIVLGQVARRRG